MADNEVNATPATNAAGALVVSEANPRYFAVAAGDAPFGLHNVDPALRHATITGTGHWLQMDRPDSATNSEPYGFSGAWQSHPFTEAVARVRSS